MSEQNSSTTPPPIGALVKFEYKAWRVIEYRKRDDTHYNVILRPPGVQYDFAQYNEAVTAGIRYQWQLLDEHYSICAIDGDVQPCRHQEAEKKANALLALAARYETPGTCPTCMQQVTPRMQSKTFEENLYVPLGPPVVFHLRTPCGGDASRYEQALNASKVPQEPERK